MADVASVRARLWDGPTRIVHWALVVLIGFAWWSAEAGKLEWHRITGYAVLGLVVFRLIWGVVGSASAQFASFVRGPSATLAYLRTLPSRIRTDWPGHNPLGAWSVMAILAVLALQVATGLFATDIDQLDSGPLSDRVSFDLSRQFSHWHRLSFQALEALVVLHVAAVVFYLAYKRANLIWAMITGRQRFADDPNLTFAPPWRSLAAALAAAALAWWAATGFRL